MAHTPVQTVAVDDFGKASWANAVAASDADLTTRVEDLEDAAGSGSVTGPVSSTDNAIARFDGTGGATLQNSGITIPDGASGSVNGVNTGDVTLAGTPDYITLSAQVITRALINLTSHVVNRLPWANVVQVTAGRLLGRASTSGTGDAEELTLGVGLAWNGTAIDCTVTAPTGTETGSRLVSGGEIVWISAYTFTVSAATYVIVGTQYTSAEQTVALTAADLTDDRIDVIAVDDTGTVVVIDGTAAPQPSEPDIDPSTQLKLGIVFVAAGSSAPTVTTEAIYANNTGGPGEWNWTTSGSGFNVNSTNNPHAGTKDIEGTTVSANAYALATKPSGTLDITTYSLIVFYIRSKVTWNNNRSLQIQFRNAGVLVGSPVTFKHNTYGFDSTNITTYQQIAIPITAFAIAAGTLIDQIRFMDAGGSIGFYIDDVSLQTGGSTNVTGGITQAQADARYTQRANNLSDLSSASTARGNLSAAPNTPSYLTLATNSELTSERVLTASGRVSIADAGAGSTATLDVVDASITNAKLANMAQSTIKGRAVSAGTGDPIDLTATQATAILDVMVGDSGAGGTKGLAPAPASGDAAAGKFLKADGTYAAPSGTGAPSSAQYVTLATDGGLSAERVLTGTSNQIALADGGANGNITLSTPQNIDTGATPQFGRMGLAVAADSSAKLKIAGQYGSTLYDAGNSGASKTLDWDNGNTQLLTMTASCTLTLSNPKDGFRYIVFLKQDGTGGWTPTFPGSVKWAGGTVPTWDTTIGHVDLVTLVWVAGIGASGNYLSAANTGYTPA